MISKMSGSDELTLIGTAIDWAFYTEPQEHLGGRILPYHRMTFQKLRLIS